MALVGSGTSKIQNFALAAALSSANMDESLAAFVEQLGGVKWLSGASDRSVGNLTYDNFATAPALPNSYKREASGLYAVSLRYADASVPSAAVNVGAFRVPRTGRIVAAMWAPLDLNINYVNTLSLYVDGARILSADAWGGGRAAFPMATHSDRFTSKMNVPVLAGSIVSASILTTQAAGAGAFTVECQVILASEHE